MPIHEALARFISVLERERYVGAHYLVCAFGGQPASSVLVCRFILDLAPVEENAAPRSEVGDLLIDEGWVSRDDLIAVLRTPAGEPFRLGDRLFRLEPENRDYSWSELRDHLRAGQDGTLSSRVFGGHGRQILDIVGGYQAFVALGRRLPACARPFRDWAALSDHFGLDQGIDAQRYSSLDVVLPVYARITASRIAPDGKLVAHIESTEPLSELSLVMIPDGPEAEPLRITGDTWTLHPDEGTFVAQGVCPGLIGPATLQLVAHGESVQSVRVGVPSLASRAHAALDEAGWLRNLLGLRPGAEGKAKADGFEVGVANLLSLAGFQAVRYGHASHPSFPDLIAIINERCMLVGECTVEAPDRDKVLTLCQRADALRDRAQHHPREVAVLRVVFTPRPRSEVALPVVALAEDKAQSVALVCQEQLAELLAMANNGEDPETIARAFLRWIGDYRVIRL